MQAGLLTLLNHSEYIGKKEKKREAKKMNIKETDIETIEKPSYCVEFALSIY